LEAVAAALLSLHAVALREFKSLEKSVPRRRAVAAVDVDAGGRSAGGAHLCGGDRRSGAPHLIEVDGGEVLTVLYKAAHVILTRPIKGGALKSWAMKLARRAGMMKAKVALARKLAIVDAAICEPVDGEGRDARPSGPRRLELWPERHDQQHAEGWYSIHDTTQQFLARGVERVACERENKHHTNLQVHLTGQHR
jgi:hypothetical protein